MASGSGSSWRGLRRRRRPLRRRRFAAAIFIVVGSVRLLLLLLVASAAARDRQRSPRSTAYFRDVLRDAAALRAASADDAFSALHALNDAGAFDVASDTAEAALLLAATERLDPHKAAALLVPLLRAELAANRSVATALPVAAHLFSQPGFPASLAWLPFKLAQAYDALGFAELAIETADAANAAVRRLRPPPGLADHYALHATLAAARPFASMPPVPVPTGTATPVFIVGLPRSGTSLLEQMIAMLPGVRALGEDPLFREVVADDLDRLSALRAAQGLDTLGADVFRPALDAARAARWAAALRARLGPPGAGVVVVKRTTLYLYLPLLARLLPDARFLHCQRDWRDVGVSLYLQLFDDNVPFAYSWADIRATARAADAVMAAWRADPMVAERLLDVRYEELVSAPADVMAGVLRHLGLPWDDAVLRSHESKRSPETASNDQARQRAAPDLGTYVEHVLEDAEVLLAAPADPVFESLDDLCDGGDYDVAADVSRTALLLAGVRALDQTTAASLLVPLLRATTATALRAADPPLAAAALPAAEGLFRQDDFDATNVWLPFQLCHTWDRLGFPDRAMQACDAANRVVFEHSQPDLSGHLALHYTLAAVRPFEHMPVASSSAVSAAPRPVFIVGMPRSGTSLLEQMIAMLPSVRALGEVPVLKEVVLDDMDAETERRAARGVETLGADVFLTAYDAPTVRRWAAELRERLGASGDVVVVKRTTNFMYLPLLARLLPDALFLHCERDRRDVSLSLYMQYFGEARLRYAYDKQQINDAFDAYEALMDSVRADPVVAERLLDVRYEELVSAPADVMGGVLRHLGLPWDDAVLRPHESKRSPETASNDQVRRPINKDAIGKWERYGRWFSGRSFS